MLLVALLPLGLWVASTGFTLAGAGYDAVLAWFANPLNAALMAITAVVFFGYLSLAWKVVLEDYVPNAGTRRLLVALLTSSSSCWPPPASSSSCGWRWARRRCPPASEPE